MKACPLSVAIPIKQRLSCLLDFAIIEDWIIERAAVALALMG